MKRVVAEWCLVGMVFVLAAAARYLLIQPPDIAHACDAAAGTWWCTVRWLVILSFSTFGLGYAAIAATVLTLATWNRTVAWATTLIGAAGLILYCYEPAAVAFVTGALILARAQSGHPRPARRSKHEDAEETA